MGLKAVSISVNDYCNGKCIMCNIHNNEKKDKMNPEEYKNLLSKKDFEDVLEVSITGGEPFLRKDLHLVTESIIQSLPNLKIMFINTNGTFPNRLKKFIEEFNENVPIYVCVSLEGTRETNRKIRGIDTFELALKTLGICRDFKSDKFNFAISTTITKFNANLDDLNFLRKLSEDFGCEFTFRIASRSDTYYLNTNMTSFEPNENQTKNVIKFIRKHYSDNPFQKVYLHYSETGELPFKCRAGDVFAFIQADGGIYPCIYSKRVIGNKKSGIIQNKIEDLGSMEKCFCCGECCVYPMLNYSNS